jgi:tape measure domain-containing protein
MATNETVTLTAELKDEMSAPLDDAAKKVDDFTKTVQKGAQRQRDANGRFIKSTAQISKEVQKQRKQYTGLLGIFQKVGIGGQKLFGGLSSSVSKSWQRIAGDANRSGKDAGDAFGNGLRATLKYAVAGAAVIGAGALMAGFVREAANASDATDKFRATMSFAGLNTTAIDMAAKAAKAYADQTVYDLPTIQNMMAQLASNGIKDYTGLTKAAGNLNAVAGGNADTFKSVAMVMTQTAGAGKLTTENWNQLTDAIPGAAGPLMKAMSAAGAYTGNFREEMEKGEITSDEFNKALMKLGTMPVAVEAAKSTATFEGALGNLKATINSGLMVVLDALKPKITKTITLLSDGLGGAVDKLTTAISVFKGGGTTVNIGTALGLSGNSLNMFVTAIAWIEKAHAAFDRFKTMIAGFGTGQWSGIIGGALLLVAAFGKFAPIIGLFAKLGPVFTQLGGALKFLLGPIGIIAGLFIYAYSTSEQFRNTINSLLTTVLGLVGGLLTSLMPVFQQLITAIMPILTNLMQQLVPVFTMILSAVAPLAVMLISQLAPVFLQLIGAVLPPLMGLLGVLVPIFGQLITAIAPIIPPIAEIVGLLLNLAVQILTPLIPLISSIASILATILGGAIQYVLMPVIKFLIDALVNLVTFLKGPLGEAINWIAGLFEGLGGMIKDTQKNIGDFVSNPLGGIQDMLGIPKNSGGGVYSGGGVVGAFAGGGVLGGYAPGHDSILARLSPGESVLVPELTRELGPQNIMAANAAASGGRPAGSGPALTSGYSGRGGGNSTSLSIGQVNLNVPVSAAGTVDLDALHTVAVGAMQDALDEHNRRSY